MFLVVRLPLILAETFLRQGLATVEAVVRLLRGGTDEDARVVPTVPEPAPRYGDRSSANGVDAAAAGERGPAAAPPPPTAQEAIGRRRAREESARTPRTRRPAPAPRRPPATGAHVDREATVVESVGPAEGPGAALRVNAPWEGYDQMPAAAVVQRVRGADEATKGVVRLYEQTHKARRTILAATGG
jgi:hypothetical protein